MEDFKVSLESLHTTKIKEINYEGEETYQERPTLSQRLTDLAQRVDFSESVEGEEAEPATKKAAQKWPWEYTHSKLKQALTEVSVLSDVLQIAHSHQDYVTLDQVVAQPSPPVPSTYQYTVKKKALGVAAGILRQGTKTLSTTSSHGEREFHKALSDLRQRWRLRRTPTGVIVGDLSYHSAGSQYVSSATFEVHKSEGVDSKSGEIISVNIPRELRGQSEILVFLNTRPVREVKSLAAIPPCPVSEGIHQQRSLSPWERKLVAAQSVLFNQELFLQLAKEAYNHKSHFQHEVFSNRINIPLSTDYWLSILHVRKYENEDKWKTVQHPGSSDLPTPHWELVVSLKQLLRENHLHRASLVPPRPATASFTEAPELRNAGVSALTTSQMKKVAYNDNIFIRFIQKAKHVYNEERLQRWMSELCSSCADPVLSVTWIPDLTLTSTTAHLHFREPTLSVASCTITLNLSVDKVTVQQLEGKTLTISPERDRLLRILRHQVVVHQMQLACQIAEEQKWCVLQRFTIPLLSHTLATSSTGDYLEACNIVLESEDAHKKLDVLLEWGKVSIGFTQHASEITFTNNIDAVAPKSKNFVLDSHFGHAFQQRFTNLLHSVSNAQ